MRSPSVPLDSIVVARVGGAQRVGRVVGVFMDGARACAHFRCFRCDYAGKVADGVTDELALDGGFVYLVADRDSSREFVAREEDLVDGLARAGGAVVQAADALDPEQQAPTERQVKLLHLLADRGAPPTLPELRSEVGVRSLTHTEDMVARLERKGLVERRRGGVDGEREVVVLTDAGSRWATQDR